MGPANSSRALSWTRNASLAAVCVLASVPGLIAAAPSALANGERGSASSDPQAKHGSKRKATPKPLVGKYNCGEGVELQLSTPESSQGSLLLAELRAAEPVSEINGSWDEKEIPFWPENASAPHGPSVHRALLGVDLEKPAGTYEFAVIAQAADGDPVACRATIAVRAGKFATEKLKVAPNFVEPNAEQLARAQEEQKRLREIYATLTPKKLWDGPFRVPLDGVTTGGNFGRRRVLNGQPGSPHSGVDFPAPTGTPVHAAQSGRVVLAEPLYFSGNTVVVDHGLGVYTLYAHFSEIDVKPGDTGARPAPCSGKSAPPAASPARTCTGALR